MLCALVPWWQNVRSAKRFHIISEGHEGTKNTKSHKENNNKTL
jgi:hypothetical protein